MSQTKTPQNINDLVSEIGERMTLFMLYAQISEQTDLEIFKNYSEPGYDIGLRSNSSAHKVKIEVKTRQHLVSTDKRKNICHFTVTEHEWQCANFLVGYWLDYNDFFIVPVSRLSKTKSGKDKDKQKIVYKLVFSRLKTGNTAYSPEVMEFLNNWQSILDFAAKRLTNATAK